MKQNIIIGALLLILGLVSGLFLCRSCSTPEEVEIVQIDSVVVRDTVREYYPVEIKTERIDTMLLIVRDTVRVKDTLYMSLPLQRRTYKRDDFYAEVTGYNPRLTYIEVYPETVYVTTEKVSSVNAKNSIGLGIETSYLNTLSIPIYLEYGRMLHKNVEIYGQIFYDLPGKQWGAGIGAEFKFDW